MVARPTSLPEARAAMSAALTSLNARGIRTRCQDRPVPYADVRQTPAEAATLCGVGTDDECPLLALCAQKGFTEGIYADDMVYGGLTWRRGLPLVSETAYQEKRAKAELKKIASKYR
jgi:hypothetical protein